MQNDLISVIIPCYNQANFLDSAITSAQKQTHRNTEIIVVDDGSTDNTFEIASKYETVQVIQQTNQGLSAARNTGLSASNGNYIVFLDADDQLLPNALEAGLKCITKHPEAAFVYGGYKVIFYNGSSHPDPILYEIKQNYYSEILRRNFIGMHATVLYKRCIFNIVGGFDTSFKACEDYDLYCRILKNFPIHCHDEIIAEYHRHGKNMSTNARLMLDTSMTILKSQRDCIRGRAHYKSAYQAGINWWHRHYGDPLALEIQRNIRARRFKPVLQSAKVLIKHHPRGIIRAFFPKIYSGFYSAYDVMREAFRYLKRCFLAKSTGFIKANPKLIATDDFSGTREKTELSWISHKTKQVEVHIGAPNGPLLSRSGPKGNAVTGNWIQNSMVFFLQDVSDGLPLSWQNTLSTVRVIVSSSNKSLE